MVIPPSPGFSWWTLPSGKRLHNHGKSPFSMGQSTFFMAIFNTFVYQRVISNHSDPLELGISGGPLCIHFHVTTKKSQQSQPSIQETQEPSQLIFSTKQVLFRWLFLGKQPPSPIFQYFGWWFLVVTAFFKPRIRIQPTKTNWVLKMFEHQKRVEGRGLNHQPHEVWAIKMHGDIQVNDAWLMMYSKPSTSSFYMV